MNNLNDNDEALLARFREWLHDARVEADGLQVNQVHDRSQPEVGLYRLVEEFTALRHEVKLETKGSRGLQEQIEGLLPTIRQAVDTFKSVGPKEEQAVIAAARPLAEAIANLDEALDRGRLEIEKARDRLDAEARQTVASIASEFDALFQAQPWFRRFGLRAYHDRARDLVVARLEQARPALFHALLEGYALIQSRLAKAMDAGQIRRIDCQGSPVDPDRMIVIEVVDADEQQSGHVVDELRRGYTWRGRVLRYAEVRAARERRLQADADDLQDEIVEEPAGESNSELENNSWN